MIVEIRRNMIVEIRETKDVKELNILGETYSC